MVEHRENVRRLGQRLKIQAAILGSFIGLMWLLEIIDWLLLNGALDVLGIRPRTTTGLQGILFSPFLHFGFSHLITNTVPFFVLGWFVMLRRTRDFFLVTAITALISGLGVWLTGPPNSIHIGASGLIFGYFGFLLLRGYFERSAASILWSILVFFLYGSLLLGVLPQGMGISWQGHLFGFIGGALAAYLLTNGGTAADSL